jgi:hypothetical protein
VDEARERMQHAVTVIAGHMGQEPCSQVVDGLELATDEGGVPAQCDELWLPFEAFPNKFTLFFL